jgi:hypothetical protein
MEISTRADELKNMYDHEIVNAESLRTEVMYKDQQLQDLDNNFNQYKDDSNNQSKEYEMQINIMNEKII